MELAEALDLVERHLAVAAQVQPRVEEHRAMAGREDEPIAVEPLGVRRGMPERVPEEHGANLGAAQGQAEVAALALVHGVEGEATSDGGRAGEALFRKLAGHRNPPQGLRAFTRAPP